MINTFFFLQPGSAYNDNITARYSSQPQLINSSSHTQFELTPFTQLDQQVNHPNQIQNATYDNTDKVGLALGPFEDWSSSRNKGVEDDFLSEEEIRMRSHEMLENEDMQHLLRLFSMGGHASVNVPEDGFSFPSYIPSPSPDFSYGEDRTRSGKAVTGWLKIKAAMRWGIFIRKKAAERRARIVELEDE